MAQGFVQVPADSVGKKVDTFVTAGGQHRQVVAVGDPTTDANIVTIPSTLKLPVQSEAQLDYDTGAGTQNLSLVGIALPASGGAVAGGTSTNPIATTDTPQTSGGTTNKHVVSAGSDNAQNIKASAGQVYSIHVYNNAAYPIYLKFHNTAGTPIAGAGVVYTVGVQSGTQRDLSLKGIAFSTGIGITIVKDIADAGTTAVVASDCVVEIEYK